MKKAFHRHCKTHPLEVSNNSLLQKVREFSDTSLYIYTEYMDASQIYEYMDAMLLSDIIHMTLHDKFKVKKHGITVLFFEIERRAVCFGSTADYETSMNQ